MKFSSDPERNGPREQPTEDRHNATLAYVWDVGMQPGYKGKAPRHKVCVCFELEQRDSKGRPFLVFREETASLWKSESGGKAANLRRIADTVRPGKDNSEKAVNAEGGTIVFHGLPCRVDVEYDDRGKARCTNVAKAAVGQVGRLVGTYSEDKPLGLAKYMSESRMTPEQVAAALARIRAAQEEAGGGPASVGTQADADAAFAGELDGGGA